MITIKNLEPKELEFSFEGLTYYFPKGSITLVEEKLAEYLKELVPLAFDFDYKVPKGTQVSKVRTAKTKSYLSPTNEVMQDMKVTKLGRSEATLPDEETQGPEYYGAGIEVEDIK